MLVIDDAFLKIMEIFFWHFQCFKKMHTIIVHFKSLVSLS